MPHPSPKPLTYYPAYCFPLSPTHNAWAKLTAVDVHGLEERSGFEGQNLYFHLNHPIKWIRLVGVVVAFDIFPTRWIMILDDSSGATIEITCGRSIKSVSTDATGSLSASANGTTTLNGSLGADDASQIGTTATGRTIDLCGVDVGVVVKAKGGVSVFRGQKQIVLERISIVRSTNEEAAAWAELSAFRKDVLSKAWVVSEKEEVRARRKAEGLQRGRKEREERKRKKSKLEGERKRSAMEKQKRDRSTERLFKERKTADDVAHRQRRVKPQDTGAKVPARAVAVTKVARPTGSGNFDALGL